MRRFDDARQRLYDELGYRDELTDDEADVLFAWGEAQFARLDADADADDAAGDRLLKVIAALNRAAGMMSADQLAGVPDLAATIGLSVDAGSLTAALASADDPLMAIGSLVALLTPANGTSSAPTDDPDAAPSPAGTPTDYQAAWARRLFAPPPPPSLPEAFTEEDTSPYESDDDPANGANSHDDPR